MKYLKYVACQTPQGGRPAKHHSVAAELGAPCDVTLYDFQVGY